MDYAQFYKNESDMDFSPLFERGNTIYIEKSKFRNKLGDGVKTVEFLTLMPGKENKLYFIEAKKTAPNPTNKGDFNKYCDMLLEKVQHSLDLFASKELEINRDLESEFPDCFDTYRFNEYRLIFLLIIRNHEKGWCSDVLDGLQKKILALRSIWKLDVVVWNGEKAQEKRFITH